MLHYMAQEMAFMWLDVYQSPGESDKDFIISMFRIASCQ